MDLSGISFLSEMFGSNRNSLEFNWSYSWGIPGGYIAVMFQAQLYVGWRLEDVHLDEDLWNVTITPYLQAFTNFLSILDVPAIKISQFTDLDFFEIKFPIFLLYEKDYRYCYKADMHLLPVNLNSTLNVQPSNCTGEIMDNIINQEMPDLS